MQDVWRRAVETTGAETRDIRITRRRTGAIASAEATCGFSVCARGHAGASMAGRAAAMAASDLRLGRSELGSGPSIRRSR
jgi:hypothetical protein